MSERARQIAVNGRKRNPCAEGSRCAADENTESSVYRKSRGSRRVSPMPKRSHVPARFAFRGSDVTGGPRSANWTLRNVICAAARVGGGADRVGWGVVEKRRPDFRRNRNSTLTAKKNPALSSPRASGKPQRRPGIFPDTFSLPPGRNGAKAGRMTGVKTVIPLSLPPSVPTAPAMKNIRLRATHSFIAALSIIALAGPPVPRPPTPT